jgi:LuxR family maltose regulon positive regulatory protein
MAWSQIVPFTVVRVLLAEGSAKSLVEAAQMLPVMQQIASTAGSLLHRTQLLVFEAVLHDQLGAHERALATLREAIMIAEPSRAIRLFADLGTENDCRVRTMLLELDRQSEPGNFACQVWTALSVEPHTAPQMVPSSQADSPQRAVPPRELIDHLTSREIEILMLLDKGYSNKEIAEALFISYKTVENHTTSIYQKLEVRSRMQAVRRAKELHLIPLD